MALLRLSGADGTPDVDPLGGYVYVMGKGRKPRQMSLSPESVEGSAAL